MVFVMQGGLEYHHGEKHFPPSHVEPGQWACEEVLWSRHAQLAGPVIAMPSGCDVLCILPDEFRALAKGYKETRGTLSAYAAQFIEMFNAESRAFSDSDDIPDSLMFNE